MLDICLNFPNQFFNNVPSFALLTDNQESL